MRGTVGHDEILDEAGESLMMAGILIAILARRDWILVAVTHENCGLPLVEVLPCEDICLMGKALGRESSSLGCNCLEFDICQIQSLGKGMAIEDMAVWV